MFHLMNKKDIYTIILKVLIYILTLLLGAVGAQALSSCSSPYSTISHYGTVVERYRKDTYHKRQPLNDHHEYESS